MTLTILQIILTIVLTLTTISLLKANNKGNINPFAKERRLKNKSKIKIEFIASDPHHDGAYEWRFYNGWFYHRAKGSSEEWVTTKNIKPTPERITVLASLVAEAKYEKRKQSTNTQIK